VLEGKGDITQNVLAACGFDMNFVYVLAGWEGSAHDSRVLADARSKGFAAPPGRYYLADAGYSNSALTLVPYRKTRYHLQEHARASQKPQNAKELYNLRHSSLRNVIERTFGVFKNRFAILQKQPRMYTIQTQIQLVLALAAVHNFMNLHGHDPEAESNELGYQESEEGDSNTIEAGDAGDDAAMAARRDDIAQIMWEDYQAYISEPQNVSLANY